MGLEKFAPLEPGSYFIDPDSDPSTRSGWCTRSLRGMVTWFGALKAAGDRQ